MQPDPTPDLDELLSPCGHERPRSASQLHGVCIFCWRDRGAKIRRERDELRSRAEKAEARAKELPTSDAIEAAKGALREAEDYMRAEGAFSFAERLRAALAKLEGR